MEPSESWKTSREEIVRLIERLKAFVRKEFRVARAEEEQKRAASTVPVLESLATTPLRGAEASPLASLLHQRPPTFRFQQQQRAQMPLEPPAGPQFNSAGALLDSLQPPAERALAASLTSAVLSGKLPFTELLQLAAAPSSAPAVSDSAPPSDDALITPVQPPEAAAADTQLQATSSVGTPIFESLSTDSAIAQEEGPLDGVL